MFRCEDEDDVLFFIINVRTCDWVYFWLDSCFIDNEFLRKQQETWECHKNGASIERSLLVAKLSQLQ